MEIKNLKPVSKKKMEIKREAFFLCTNKKRGFYGQKREANAEAIGTNHLYEHPKS